MGDFGAKVSQRGYSVTSAKDYQLEYNSGFPMIPIIKEQAFTVTNNVGGTIATHSLLFHPMFLIFHDDRTTGSFGTGAVGQSHMTNNFLNNLYTANLTTIAHSGLGGATSTTGKCYVFGIDLEKNFTAPIIESGTGDEENTGAKNYGIRVSKDGKDVFSEDLRDFTIHSGTRAPLIHSVTYGTHTAGATVTVTHNLGYIPFPFLYWEYTAGAWTHIPNQAVAVTTTQAQFQNPAGGTGSHYSLVLLKEPLSVN